MEWNDLRLFLAVARGGTLGAAARSTGLTQPTMGRRIRALEASVGDVLFQRTTEGFILTEEGQTVLAHAERMEEEALALDRQLAGGDQGLTGIIRLSCSDWFGTTLLTPVLAEFARLHPRSTVEMLTDTRLYSLARREADLAFRIRPFDEPEAVSRRLLHIDYAAYVAKGLAHPRPGDGADCPLVLMDTAFGGIVDVKWIERLLPKAHVVSRSNNRMVQAQLCALGAGLAVLPKPLAAVTPGIEEVDLGEAAPGRDTWIGYHRDLRSQRRLRALFDLAVSRLGN